MTKSNTHKTLQNKAADKNGKTEVKLKNGQKLDALSSGGKRATEVERSGNFTAAAHRLKISGAKDKVMQVHHKDMVKQVSKAL